MANLLLGQPASHLVGSSGAAIPPPPSFADFKFTTIGQEPQLLKRISAPTADFPHREPSSPSPSTLPELEYPSRPASRSRPSLLQSLTGTDSSTDVVMVDIADDMAVANDVTQKTLLRNTYTAYQTKARLSSPSRTPADWHPDIPHSSPAPDGTGTQGIASTPTPLFPQRERSMVSISSGAIVPAATMHSTTAEINSHSYPRGRSSSTYGADSSYTALRALQLRLLSSLSNLKPPNTTEALLLVEAANSHSANALSTAHRSHNLAQQSLASAREAVAAAQECLSAAEQAKAHASDAVAAVEQLSSGNMAGNTEWEWKSTVTQLQDDLRALGEWVGEREGEEALKRREADRVTQERKHKETVQAAMGMTSSGGLDPLVIQAMSLEVARKVTEVEARMSVAPTRQLAPPSTQNQERQRSAELEANAAMRAWSSEHGHAPQHLPVTTPDVVQDTAEDSGESFALDTSGNQLQSSSPERAARLGAQHKTNRICEVREENPEVAMLEREQIEAEECSNRSADELRLKHKREGGLLNCQTQSFTVVEEAKPALETHEEKERVIGEQRRLEDEVSTKAVVAQQPEEAKRAETRRLEQRKQRELEELRKRQAEKAAELEREAEARELELIAEQGRRRQEVMAQKQRVSAETAARINAERARENKKSASSSISPGSIGSHSLSNYATEYGNLVAQKTMTSVSSKKPRSISGGVKLGPTATDQSDQMTPHSLPPSPSLTRSAALGLQVKKPSTATAALTASQSRADGTEHKSVPPTDIDEFKNLATTDKALFHEPPSKAAFAVPPLVPRYSTPTSLQETGHLHVQRRSEDPGNMCVVPRSQVPPASPEAQAANLRFVKPNGVLWDHYLMPSPDFGSVKQEPPADDSSPAQSEKDDIATSKGRPSITRDKRVDEEAESSSIPPPNLKVPLPNKPYSFPPARKVKLPNSQDQQANAMSDQTNTAPMTTAPTVAIPPLPVHAVSSPSVASPISTASQPAKPTVNLKRPPQTLPASSQTHTDRCRGDPAFTSQTNATQLPLLAPQVPTQPTAENPTTKLRRTLRLSEPKQHDDHAQIAPIIQDNGGWDWPSTSVDDEGYGVVSRNDEPARLHPGREKYRRGGDHYSPVPRSLSPSYQSRPLPPVDVRAMKSYRPPRPNAPSPEFSPRSPVLLGKRRYREDSRLDEPPARRHWSPEDERDREEQTYMSRSMWPSPAWRSPSPERPALQARIGVRDYMIGNGQSYRPTYASDTYDRPQSLNFDNYQRVGDPEYTVSYGQSAASHTLPTERHKLGRHLVADSRIERAPSSGRGRGGNSNYANRGGNRGRGGRGGSRPLNLEQRISSQQPLTLMHRLESPPRTF